MCVEPSIHWASTIHPATKETPEHIGGHQPRPHVVSGEGDASGVSGGPLLQGTTMFTDAQFNCVTTFAPPEVSIIDLQRRKLRHRTCMGLSSSCHRKARVASVCYKVPKDVFLSPGETDDFWTPSLGRLCAVLPVWTIPDSPSSFPGSRKPSQAELQLSLLNVFSTKLKSYFILN